MELNWKPIFKSKPVRIIKKITFVWVIANMLGVGVGGLRKNKDSDKITINFKKEMLLPWFAGAYNYWTNDISLLKNDGLSLREADKIIVHELTHARNATFGYMPIAQNELSAICAERLHELCPTMITDLNDTILSYKINYEISDDCLYALDYVLENALSDWDKRKGAYKSNMIIYSLSAALAKNTLDSAFTFTVNGKDINLFKQASEKIQKKVKSRIYESNMFIMDKEKSD